MGVNKGQPQLRRASAGLVRNEDGQSVLEFALMLPMLLILTMMMIKVNTVIQVSIVNQKYSRAQTLLLADNSSDYPRIELRERQLVNKGYSQMIIGVSDNQASDGDYQPAATVQNITRKGVRGSGEERAEPQQRSDIRVRTTVALCTQPNFVNGSAVIKLEQGSNRSFVPAGPWRLNEGTRYDLCGGDFK